MPRANPGGGGSPKKVRRPKSGMSARESLYYGGSKPQQRQAAASIDRNLRRVRRASAVEQFKKTRVPGSKATLSIKQEATALRTLARQASTPQEWRQLQVKSDTGQALPNLETKIKDRRNREIFNSFPKEVQRALTLEADAQFATKVFKYAKTIPNFPKSDLQRLKKKAFNKRQNAQGVKLRLAEGSADINAKSPLIGLDKKGNINRIGPDPRLDGNSIGNIVGDLIPDQPWEIALVAGTRGIGVVGSAALRGGAEAAGNIIPRTGRIARMAAGAGRARRAVRSGIAAAGENIGSRTGATAARAAAQGAAERVTAQVPRVVRTGARTGAKAATYPIRNPGKTTLAASGANVYSQTAGGTPLKTAALTPQKGIFTAVTTPAVKLAPGAIAENFLKDLVDLPVNAIPSLFLAGKAGIQAVNGNDEMLNKMLKDYIKTGFLPNAVNGDWEAAGEAFVNHPLYVLLGASGGYALVGRGLREAIHVPGAVLEHIPTKGTRKIGRDLYNLASDERPNLKLNRNGMQVEQKYSKNLITKGIQRGMERGLKKRGKDPFYAPDRPGIGQFKLGAGAPRPDKAKKMQAANDVASLEGARRIEVQEAPLPLYKENRSFLQRWGRAVTSKSGLDIPRSLRGVAVLFANGMVRTPKLALSDLKKLRDMWESEYQADRQLKASVPPRERSTTGWKRNQIDTNRALVKAVDEALASATKEDIAQMFAVKDRFLIANSNDMEALQRANLLADEQIRTATVRPFAVAHMGGRWDEKLKAFVDPSGKKLSLAKVEAEMKGQGVTAGFVTERPRFKGAKGNFYQAANLVRGRADRVSKKRTGRAAAGGLFDASAQTLSEQLVASTTVANRAEAVDILVRRSLARDEKTGDPILTDPVSGKPFGYQDTQDILDDPQRMKELGLDPNESWVPVKISRGGNQTVGKDEAWRILNTSDRFGDNIGAAEKLVQSRLNEITNPDTPGDWGFVPQSYFKVVQSLNRPQNTLERVISTWSNVFKGVILPLSPKWVIGNIVDPTLRAVLEGLHPLYWVVARNSLQQIQKDNPRLRRELDVPLLGGTLFGTATSQRIRRLDPQQWDNATSIGTWMKIWAGIRETPGPRQIGDAYAWYRDTMFRVNNQLFESFWQKGLFGKEQYRRLRNLGYTLYDAMKPGSQAYIDLSKGITGSPSQLAHAKAVWRMSGRWNTLTNFEKDLLSYAVPFGLWLKAAYQFVAVTLPRHHPIKVAIGTQIAQMTEEDRKRLGLSFFSDAPVQDWYMGSLPISDNKWYRPQFASSFGMFTDPAGMVGNSIFSQYTSGIFALLGLDWKGDELVSTGKLGGEAGAPLQWWEKTALAMANLMEISVPLVMQITNLAGSSIPEKIALPSYADPNEKKQFVKDRLMPLVGLKPVTAQDIANSKKYRVTKSIQVPASGSSSRGTTGGQSIGVKPSGKYVPGVSNVKGF